MQLRCAVGGMGVAAPWRTLVLPFINDVQGLDFVSFHFYGTHNASTDTDTLMKAAITGVAVDLPNQLPLNLLHALVRQRWGAHAGVYITEANINSVRNDDGSARDERIAQPQAMAWWLTFLQTASSTVNEIIQYKLCGGGWGLIDDAGMPTPAYWAVWLFNIYAPRDSDICRLVSADGAIKGMAVRTPTALNVLMANVRSEPIRIEVTVEWRSAPHLKMVRLRRILPAGVSVSQPTYEILSRESTQRVLLPGYGIAVLQFVPLGNAG
ncbi:MAG TPA: hypothetical protein EYP10_10910 [Armatimonadetes bacterium]|nr:hypothetical protein [Armatimonadota bacterium]